MSSTQKCTRQSLTYKILNMPQNLRSERTSPSTHLLDSSALSFVFLTKTELIKQTK